MQHSQGPNSSTSPTYLCLSHLDAVTMASQPLRQEEGWVSPVLASLTLEMESGMLKSFPPCSLKPQGAGPFSITL